MDDLLLGLADMGYPYSCQGTFLARYVVCSDAGVVWAHLRALGSESGAIQTGLVHTVFTYEPYPNPPLLTTRFSALPSCFVGVQDGKNLRPSDF